MKAQLRRGLGIERGEREGKGDGERRAPGEFVLYLALALATYRKNPNASLEQVRRKVGKYVGRILSIYPGNGDQTAMPSSAIPL